MINVKEFDLRIILILILVFVRILIYNFVVKIKPSISMLILKITNNNICKMSVWLGYETLIIII